MRNGLIAGSVAAIVAALVSLPLHSPVDNVFNTATVAVATLLVGVAAGLIWDRLASNPRRLQYYAGSLALGLIAVVVIAVVGNTLLERLITFTIPLAAIAFVVSGVLAPNLGRLRLTTARWAAPAVLTVAAVVGFGLVGQGDGESGDLSLPERVQAPATAESAASESTVAESATDSLQYLVTEGSEITFTVGEQLTRLPLPNDAVVRTTALSGQLNFDGQPSEVAVDLSTLSSDQDFRDQYMRGRMFNNNPVAVFTVNDLSGLPDEFFSGEMFTRQVAGILNINGVDVPLTFDLEIRNDGDVLNILASTVFTWDQVQMPVPTARIVVSVEDEVSVQLLLVAKPA